MVKALSYLADRLTIEKVSWSIKRNDEMTGIGSGHVWQAELAPPLWTADVSLAPAYNAAAEGIATLFRSLHGAQEPFFLYNPIRRFPLADPKGTLLGSSSVSIASLGSNRQTLSLKGLPAGYVLTRGDKLQLADPAQFVEVVEDVTANGSGVTPLFQVFPHLRTATAVNNAVTLKNAACAMIIIPESHNPGTAQGGITSGAGFQCIEKRL